MAQRYLQNNWEGLIYDTQHKLLSLESGLHQDVRELSFR